MLKSVAWQFSAKQFSLHAKECGTCIQWKAYLAQGRQAFDPSLATKNPHGHGLQTEVCLPSAYVPAPHLLHSEEAAGVSL
jgi:hypothetical protein